MTNLMTQAYFPNFVPNQILTNVQLNELRQFLDEQNRLTRTRLTGMGIVCGLFPVLTEGQGGFCVLTISEGFGITSEGYLIEIPETVLVQVRNYTDPYREQIEEAVLPGNNGLLWPVYEPWRLPVGNIDLTQTNPVTQIPIRELLTQAELDDPTFVQEMGNISAPITKVDLKDKVLVLYLEMDPQNLKSCLTTDCNNKGQNLHLHVRVLLIDWQYLEPVVPCTPQIDLIQVPRLHLGLRKTQSIGLDGVTSVFQINTAYKDIAQFIKTALVPKVQAAYNGWSPFIGLSELKPYIDDLDARLTAILAQSVNQYHYDFFKDLAQAYNEFSKLLCELVKDCCIAGNFPRHLMLGEFLCVCVDLDAGNDGALMQQGLTQAGNEVKLSNGIRAKATSLVVGNNPTNFGFGRIENPFFNFGSGKIWRFNNMGVIFDFAQLPNPVKKISFDFYHAGGTDNLSVNGQPLFKGRIFNAPANIAPNITLSVSAGPSPANPANTVGKITLAGAIQTVQIGGQELWIDNLCTGDIVLDTQGQYRNHFMPSPVRNVVHNDLERARKLFWRIIDLTRYFQIPSPAAIKITPSQTEVFELGKRAVPYYYRNEARPNWPPALCCTPPALNYADNTMAPPVVNSYLNYLQNPLHYSVLPHTFYRIEGHVGQPCAGVLNTLDQLRDLHNLEFALQVLHLEDVYNAPDNSQIEVAWVGIANNWFKINLPADSGNFDTAQYKFVLAAIAAQNQNLLELNRAWVEQRKNMPPPCDLSALQSDYLQVRAELFCLIHKIKPVWEQLPVLGKSPEDRNVCVTFENLTANQQFGGNLNSPGSQIFVENGIPVTVQNFRQVSGAVSFNFARVESSSNKFISQNNINLRFDFTGLDFVPTEVTFLIRDQGGSENIAVNDNPIVVGQILQKFGGQPIAPGITFDFVPFPGNPTIGTCTLKGNIKSFLIGGQEFSLDQVCAKGKTVGSPGISDPQFVVRFAQLDYLCRLLDEITKKDLRCLNYALFSRALKQMIGTAIEIRLHLALFYQTVGPTFNAYQYYPVWQDMEHCLGHLHYNCLLPRFANLYYTLEYLLQGAAHIFRNFAKDHPGLEHQAGVPKGGTFILLCEEHDNTTEVVVADFALEHFLDSCCCHIDVSDLCLPPVALPDYRIAGTATTLTIDVIDNDFYQNDAPGLEIVLISSVSDKGGALSLGGSAGPILYTRPASRVGIDHFAYRLIDRACNGLEDVGHVYVLLGQGVTLCPFPRTKSLDQLKGLAPWRSQPLFTVGETINSYTPPGILNGIGAMRRSTTAVRFYVSHHLRTGQSYSYALANGLQLAGPRISYIDYDFKTQCFLGSGLAYRAIYDRQGEIVNTPIQLNTFAFFGSTVLYRAGQYGFKDDIYFTGENVIGGGNGTAFALDLKLEELHAVPFLGRASWKNVAALDTGNAKFIALLIGDNRPGAKLLLYIGEKDAAADALFLARNGLAKGRLFAWATQGITPTQFHGTGNQRSGRFMPIAHYDPAKAGTDSYDAQGFAEQDNLDDLYRGVEAFAFSNPADLSTNPNNGRQVVFASTGLDTASAFDKWGTVYQVDVEFSNLAAGAILANLTILYDANDVGGGQFSDPDLGLRNPDNLDWTKNGAIYIQENPTLNAFGENSGQEASVWEMNPANGKIQRIASIDRAAVPTGQTDLQPNALGSWPSSGILDVSELFDIPSNEVLLVCDVQADVEGGAIDSGDLVKGGQLLFLHRPAIVARPVTTKFQVLYNLKASKVDLYVDNDLLIKDFSAHTASPYLNLPVDTEILIGIAPPDSKSAAEVMQQFPVTLKENKTYVAVVGAPAGNTATPELVLSDKATLEASTPNEVSLSFFQGSPDAPTLTVTANGSIWFKSVEAGQFKDAITVPAETYLLTITPAKVNADPNDLYLADLSFVKGHSALIFTSGSLQTGDFSLWVSMSNGGVFPLPAIKKDAPAGPQQVVIKVPKTDINGQISFGEMTMKFEVKPLPPILTERFNIYEESLNALPVLPDDAGNKAIGGVRDFVRKLNEVPQLDVKDASDGFGKAYFPLTGAYSNADKNFRKEYQTAMEATLLAYLDKLVISQPGALSETAATQLNKAAEALRKNRLRTSTLLTQWKPQHLSEDKNAVSIVEIKKILA